MNPISFLLLLEGLSALFAGVAGYLGLQLCQEGNIAQGFFSFSRQRVQVDLPCGS